MKGIIDFFDYSPVTESPKANAEDGDFVENDIDDVTSEIIFSPTNDATSEYDSYQYDSAGPAELLPEVMLKTIEIRLRQLIP